MNPCSLMHKNFVGADEPLSYVERKKKRRRGGVGGVTYAGDVLGAEANIVAAGQIYWRIMKKRLKKHGAAIQKQRRKRGSRQIVFIGAMFADVVILAS